MSSTGWLAVRSRDVLAMATCAWAANSPSTTPLSLHCASHAGSGTGWDVGHRNKGRDGAYETERSGAAAERDAEQALVRLLRRVAFVTPRDDQWERNWLILHAEARDALRACTSEAGRVGASA